MRATVQAPRDGRRTADFVRSLTARAPGYLPDWALPPDGPGRALHQVVARYLELLTERLDRVPEASRVAFLRMLGQDCLPPQAARAPLVFAVQSGAEDVLVPKGTRASATAEDGGDQLVFETEAGIGVMSGSVVRLVADWPGRDQYRDLTDAAAEGARVAPFERAELVNTPHELYVAHADLLALSGDSMLDVRFDLTHPGSESLDWIWEYWDGEAWRHFLRQHPECAGEDDRQLDGTAGLTRSGRIRLEADCVESQEQEIAGIRSRWIRARLRDPLPPQGGRILPEVGQIALSAQVEQRLHVSVQDIAASYSAGETTGEAELAIRVLDTAGSPLAATVEVVELGETKTTDADGLAHFNLSGSAVADYTVEVSVLEQAFERVVRYSPFDNANLRLDLVYVVAVQGLLPEAALQDEETLDLSKPFYPFGRQTQPGSAFLIACDECFTKPGALLRIHIQVAATPEDELRVSVDNGEAQWVDRRVAWEYWDGSTWRVLEQFDGGAETSPRDFSLSGDFSLVVPRDMRPVEVAGEERIWLRARIASGTYATRQTVTWTSGVTNEFTYLLPRPPALSSLQLSYTWQDGPRVAESVVSANAFRYEDHSEALRWPGASVRPFLPASEEPPALYLGVEAKPPPDRIGVFFDVEESHAPLPGPLVLEAWEAAGWRELGVDDTTNDLAATGILSFFGPRDPVRVSLFGHDLYWVRVRMAEDGPPPFRPIGMPLLNAVWASQVETIAEERIGRSDGRPSQRMRFRRRPVLAGERVEVRERLGPRANVEWRLIAAELLGDDPETLRALEDALASEGPARDIVRGDLRLRRGADKKVEEVWVRWTSGPLGTADESSRRFSLDRLEGRLVFGDGRQGRVPPGDAEVVAREYRTGGGAAGNVTAGAISQVLAGIPGLESVTNPAPAESGADGEHFEAFSDRAPASLRHRGRSVLPRDFEAMAREASPAVALARCLPTTDAGGYAVPGWVTVVIVPRSAEPRPYPSQGLRERVRRHLAERVAASLVAEERIRVIGPEYHAIDVAATIRALDPSRAGTVRADVSELVSRFFHPLDGGVGQRGWPPGQDVFLSDVARVVESVAGVDHALEITLAREGRLLGTRAHVPAEHIATLGSLAIGLEA